jgi:DNA-directed RNA polymerase subunit beta'
MQQLAGMRGLMAKPSGEIIETPIRANFREGLSMLEYFSTARCTRPLLSMKESVTPQAGYLLRKLCDAMHATVVLEDDCGALTGIPKKAIYKGEEVDVPLKDVIRGRTSVETIINPMTDEVIVRRNEVITDPIAAKIEALGLSSVYLRSPFTCKSARGVCSKCYGLDGSTGRPVEIGMAVGIIAAQSIGEPVYQLSMRGHHQVESRRPATSRVLERAAADGTIRLQGCGETVMHNDELVALEVDGECVLIDALGVAIQRCTIPLGSRLFVRSGDTVRQGDRIAECDTSRRTVRATNSGTIRFNDLIEDETVRMVERSDQNRTADLMTIQHYGPLRPRLDILDARGRQLEACALISGTTVLVRDGQQVIRGEVIAVRPWLSSSSSGFEHVVSGLIGIFEAREPRRPAATAEISGQVEVLRTRWRGKAVVRVTDTTGVEHDHHVDLGRTLFVQSGDHVDAGDKLSAGERSMSDLLRTKGEDAVFEYLLTRTQKLFRDWSLEVRDTHFEVVFKRMLSKVRVTDSGDSCFVLNDVVERSEFQRVNDALVGLRVIHDSGGTGLPIGLVTDEQTIRTANSNTLPGTHCRTRKSVPAAAKILLTGVSKLALQSESFLSRASFQETAKVLTEAALAGAVDKLRGLKENLLLGHLIPAGTGFHAYSKAKVRKLVDVPEYDDEAAAKCDAAEMEAKALGAERRRGAVTTVKDCLATMLAGMESPSNGDSESPEAQSYAADMRELDVETHYAMSERTGSWLQAAFQSHLEEGEQVVTGFGYGSECICFTDRRLILPRSCDGLAGTSELVSLPYQTISRFNVEVSCVPGGVTNLRIWHSALDEPVTWPLDHISTAAAVQQYLASFCNREP